MRKNLAETLAAEIAASDAKKGTAGKEEQKGFF